MYAPKYPTLEPLLAAGRDCPACEAHLPVGPRPALRAATTAWILIVGEAPGVRVHNTGIPWNDPGGERLRSWMAVSMHARLVRAYVFAWVRAQYR